MTDRAQEDVQTGEKEEIGIVLGISLCIIILKSRKILISRKRSWPRKKANRPW